jgi:hypothetical protein
MAFKIEKIGRKVTYPPGFYMNKDGIAYQIENVMLDAYGGVKISYRDPIRPENYGLVKVCEIEQLVDTLPEWTFELK